MKEKIYQVDACTKDIFGGSRSAVVPLRSWFRDELLQKMAMENDLAETTFFVEYDDKYYIRWFTPTAEVDLCGEATLAAAFVIYEFEKYPGNTIHFFSRGTGEFKVTKQENVLTLDLPSERARISGACKLILVGEILIGNIN